MNKAICPICGENSIPSQAHPTKDNYIYECPTCGNYEITIEAMTDIKSLAQEDRAKISAYTRERHIHQQPIITILSERPSTETAERPVVGISDIIEIGFPSKISLRLDRALKNLYRLSSYPGARIILNLDKDYPLLFGEKPDSALFIRNQLMEDGLIKFDGGLVITARGYNRIAELEREKAGKESKQAFVAMWFDNRLDKAWTDGFKKAIKDAGYEPLRVDLKEHNEKICDIIIAEIRKSRFMIADFTDHRGGVYFEAGYAKGLGIEVIWTCKEDYIDKSHFDTRQYNHIVWKDEKDLYEKLRRRIEATIE